MTLLSTSLCLGAIAALNAPPMLAQFPALWPASKRFNPITQSFVHQHLTLTVNTVASRPYTLVTYMFHHVDPDHFVTNMLGLVVNGLLRVPLGWNTLIVFFGGGISAALAALYEPHYREAEWSRPFWRIPDATATTNANDATQEWISTWTKTTSQIIEGGMSIISNVLGNPSSSSPSTSSSTSTSAASAIATAGSAVMKNASATLQSVGDTISSKAAQIWEPFAKAANRELVRNRMHIGMSGAVFAFMGVQSAITCMKLARLVYLWCGYGESSAQYREDSNKRNHGSNYAQRPTGPRMVSDGKGGFFLYDPSAAGQASSHVDQSNNNNNNSKNSNSNVLRNAALNFFSWPSSSHHHPSPASPIYTSFDDTTSSSAAAMTMPDVLLQSVSLSFQLAGLFSDMTAAANAASMALGKDTIPSPLSQLFVAQGVSHAGHFGGFVFGFVYGIIFYWRAVFR